MKKGRYLALLLIMTLSMTLCTQAAAAVEAETEEEESVSCLFSDRFEDYSRYGSELYAKHWDVVMQDESGGEVNVEEDAKNGFASFTVRARESEGRVTSPVVSVRKNGFDNRDRSIVYEGSFYSFDTNAKLAIAFTDAQESREIEVMTVKGGQIGIRNESNVVAAVSNQAELKTWNRYSVVLDGSSFSLAVYLNGQQLGETQNIDLGTLDPGALSLKISVKNNTGIAYSEGRIYMDDVFVYPGERPVENTAALQVEQEPVTYLNKQFTSIATNGRAHGISSFYSSVSIVDTPSELDKSAQITVGKDGAYFPLEQTAQGGVTIWMRYQAQGEIALMGKNSSGRREQLCVLPVASQWRDFSLYVDLENAVCRTQEGSETPISLENLSFVGLEGDSKTITLNKIFVYSGNKILEEDYFKDYSYQRKAIMALVTTQWQNSYATLSQGVFAGIDFYQASLFGVNLRYSTQPPRVFDGIPYVPLEETVLFLGGEILEAETGFRFLAGETEVTIGQEEIRVEKHTNYVTAQRLAELFGLTLSWDGSYLLGFGTGTLFAAGQDNESLKSALYYQRPTGEEIFDRIQKQGNVHPRIMADAERIAQVKENIEQYPTIADWYNQLVQEADSYLDAEALYYTKPDGVRLLSVSNEMVARMQALGIVYKMTGDTKYAQAAWRDLEAVCKFDNWNPTHYLDVATMSIGVGFGYSWFYDYLTDEQKDIIVAGFTKCGLESYIQGVDKREWWTVSPTNWNPWCHGGMLNAIVAMSDRLGEDAMYALDRLFPYLEYLYPEFVPDGAWVEGTSYHATTLLYLSMWCETLETATGKDFGYWDLPGMDQTAYFGDALSGSGGVFNYGDNTETKSNCAAQEWMAYKYEDYGLAQMRYNNMLMNNFTAEPYDLLMTRPEMMSGSSEMQQDIFYSNMNIVSMRTSWEDSSDGIFLAAKGGRNDASHAHYDLGGFVMDVGGVRFAYELGREGYAITQNDTNTYQYKKRAEGHNTYVINPSEDPGQIYTAEAQVVDFETKEKGGYAVIDLTTAYTEARDMKRGFLLTDDRQTMIIQDEVELTGASEVYWFMHTKGETEIANDGKTVYVTNSGVTARFDILDSDNGGAVFEIRDALPLETTPWLDGQGRNEQYCKLTIHWPSIQRYTLAVAVTQVIDEAFDNTYKGEVVPMSEWEIPDGAMEEKPKLEAITQDGQMIEGFSADKYTYVVSLPPETVEAPVFSYYAPDGVEVTQLDHEGISGLTKFIVRDPNSSRYAFYTVTVKVQNYVGTPPGAQEVPIKAVTASAEPEYEQGNRADCVLDGNYTSRWTAEGDHWIMLELEEVTQVYAVGIAWYLGDSRTYLYDLEVSEDGENWTQVFTGNSSGETTELECTMLGDQKAKYIRYQGHGHTAGTWNNITEMRVYERAQ